MSDTVVMTYKELGEAIGRSEIAARSVAIRKRWRRVLGNDGKARVAVPVELLERLRAKADARAESQSDELPDAQPEAQAHGEPDERADAHALLNMLHARVAELDGDLRDVRADLKKAQGELVEMARRLGTAEGEAAALRADRDRWAAIAEMARRPWWRRLAG